MAYGVWHRSQPGFDHKAWLAVVDYFKKLEAHLESIEANASSTSSAMRISSSVGPPG